MASVETSTQFPAQAVFGFDQSDLISEESKKTLLGGKGVGLAEMTALGIPVPPGFTVVTQVCTFFQDPKANFPGPLEEPVRSALAKLEKQMSQSFGDPSKPLLVSVRSGAAISMPGMLDTVLNIGLNRETLKQMPDRRFGLDCYRRLIEMYGNVVCGIEHHEFSELLAQLKEKSGVINDNELGAEQLEELIEAFEGAFRRSTGNEFPQDPWVQLWGAIRAVFDSWQAPRAQTYRRINHIPFNLGTAVNIQAMVFGNMGEESATGVAFTRDPGTGEPIFYGEYLANAQGEDVVAGIRTPLPIRKTKDSNNNSFEEKFPSSFQQLNDIRARLEKHYGDMQDIEFTVQQGRLFLLQTRSGKRTGTSALRIAYDMVKEKLLSKDQALLSVDANGLEQVLAPTFCTADLKKAKDRLIGRGLAAGPGAASGRIALTAERAIEMSKENGDAVILVRNETSPEDIAGMEVAVGILTTRGGMTSHAAVVARGMGTPCVVGCERLVVTKEGVQSSAGLLKEGDFISVDGCTGSIFKGRISAQASEVLQVLWGDLPKDDSHTFQRFERFMKWTSAHSPIQVRANADTPKDAMLARLLGAQGIGLCRTEHMFFGKERLLHFRRMILADSTEERVEELNKLLPYQREDFKGIFKAMDGYPVTIRLLDPPLHEFMPHSQSDIESFAKEANIELSKLQKKVASCEESNPMLGLRGCRLGLVYPEIYKMQMRAIFEAAIEASREGITVLPEIMIPLTSIYSETQALKQHLEKVLKEVLKEQSFDRADLNFLYGTMIEVPRAALTAGELATELDFFSFGTNDLTQMTYGLSRDDTTPLVMNYVENGFFNHDPFVSLDQTGVGKLIEIAVKDGRDTDANLKVGICGEHGGDPASVEFCMKQGFNYVSCSPYRVPVARLAVAKSALKNPQT